MNTSIYIVLLVSIIAFANATNAKKRQGDLFNNMSNNAGLVNNNNIENGNIGTNTNILNNGGSQTINNFCSDPRWNTVVTNLKEIIEETIENHEAVKKFRGCDCYKHVPIVKVEPLPPVQQPAYTEKLVL